LSNPDNKFNLLPSQNPIALAGFDYMKRSKSQFFPYIGARLIRGCSYWLAVTASS